MTAPVNIIPKQGIVRNQDRLWNELGSFYNLTNAKLVPGSGRIQQTPYFSSWFTWTAGTYYNGGSVTESSSTPPSLLLIIGGNTYSFGQVAHVLTTQKQVIRQTAVPATETIYTGCLLIVNDYAALGVNLGGALVVTMTGAATFTYTLNGGAPVGPLVPSTAGVSIEGGDATLYFLANGGYAGTEAWTWTRTDALFEASGLTLTNDWSYAISGSDIYFVDGTGRVVVYQNGGVRTVGYRPVYGTHIAFFADHLYVGTYSTSAASTRSDVIANSDLRDFDDFISTDTNEADTFTFRPSTFLSNRSVSPGVWGLSVFNGVLYAYTTTRIWVNQYVGLPNVNDWQEFRPVSLSLSPARPIKTKDGDYIVTTSGPAFFAGGAITQIDASLLDLVGRTTTVSSILWGGYDASRNEVYFFSAGGIDGAEGFYVYQEVTQTWYFRAAGFANRPRTMAVNDTIVCLTKGLGVLQEDAAGAVATLANDNSSGASLQLPLIETNDLVPHSLSEVDDLTQVYLDAFYTAPAGTAYSTTGVTVEYSARVYGGSTVSWNFCSPTWTTSLPDGILSAKSDGTASGRIFRFRIRPTVAAGKASFGFELNALIPIFAKLQPAPTR